MKNQIVTAVIGCLLIASYSKACNPILKSYSVEGRHVYDYLATEGNILNPYELDCFRRELRAQRLWRENAAVNKGYPNVYTYLTPNQQTAYYNYCGIYTDVCWIALECIRSNNYYYNYAKRK